MSVQVSPSFRDAQGRVHVLKVTCHTLAQFEDKTGVSVGDIGNRLSSGKRLSEFMWLAYFALKDRGGISFEDMSASITSWEQTEALMKAVGEALGLFFQKQFQETEKA